MNNRPAEVTQEKIDFWETQRQEWLKENSLGSAIYPAEAFYAGRYIDEKLDALGCPQDVHMEISTALGQRQHGSKDFWQDALHVVEEYKQGRWEKPGETLAGKLFREKFGDDADPREVISSLVKDNPNPGDFFERVMFLRFCTAYGPGPEDGEGK